MVVLIVNNCNHNITGFCNVDSYTLSGEFLFNENGTFHLESSIVFTLEVLTIIDFHPINRLTITVEADNKTASRSGIEIGPFVILEK